MDVYFRFVYDVRTLSHFGFIQFFILVAPCGMANEFADEGLSFPSTHTGSVFFKKDFSNHLRESN